MKPQQPTSKYCVLCEKDLGSNLFYLSDKGHLIKYCKSCTMKNNRWRKASLKDRGLCTTCGQNPKREESDRCPSCWEWEQQRTKAWRNSIMLDVINLYGGKCACCGESGFKFLTIDHKNNDGCIERKQSNGTRGGYTFYVQLLKLDHIREDLQVLCFNCNCGKARNNGICPHITTSKGI